MSIATNIETYQAALKAVKAHCMCREIEESGGKLIIYYPEGFPRGGLRIDQNAVMLRRALEIMEREWLASYPGGNGMSD